MADSDATVRAAIAAEIVAAAPDSVVFPFWPLGLKESEWPALLRSDEDAGKVRAWTITRRSLETEKALSGAKRRHATYLLLFFHWYDERDGGASENSFSAEVDAIVDGVSSDAGVQVVLIDIAAFGTEQLHYAVCELTRTIC